MKVGAQIGRDATALEKCRRPERGALCLTNTVSKICWCFCTGTLRRRLTRSHSIVGALSMAICQWDSRSTAWATGVSSLLWWKVLGERKKFSMSTTINTPTPHCVLCCPRWAVLVRQYSFLSVSNSLLDLRFSVIRKSRSRYALQGDLTLVVRHCWRSGSTWGRTRCGATLWETSRHPLRNTNAIRAGDVWCSTMQRGTSTEILIGGRNLASIVSWSPNCHSKTAAAIFSPRHHANPAEAHRRWRGERSKPGRLGVRDYHTRSVCAESPAQTEQWCCWLCRRPIIFRSKKRSRPIRALLGDAA